MKNQANPRFLNGRFQARYPNNANDQGQQKLADQAKHRYSMEARSSTKNADRVIHVKRQRKFLKNKFLKGNIQ